ncbi:MAG: 4-hydroxybenzoate octaprenyltransferase [Rhodovibrionaceae bacterium]|nr:4-hydroxybenzoate octaprenyltransferase [Rhodovibrionaceae bacterium]
MQSSQPKGRGFATEASDIRHDHWILRLAPQSARPYLRLIRADRPIGVWLLLWPCWISVTLAAVDAGAAPSLWLLGLFALGAYVMRGAGCTVNDIVDRDIDKKVARTAGRPIPSGDVSLAQAVLFLGALLLVGLVVLLQLHPTAIWLGVASLALVAAYPFMKRITYWPQAWLGLTFNWGALMGWAAATGEIAWPAGLLYLGGIAWTLGYDTIYGHQDKEDDLLVGVKSTSLKFGERTKPWLYGFYAAAVVFWALALAGAGAGWPAWIGLIAVAGHFAWQVATLDIDRPKNCLQRFKSNRLIGLFLFLGLLGAAALGAYGP